MNGTPFKLGMFGRHTGGTLAGIVLGDSDVIDLRNTSTGALTSTESIEGLLEDWDANFAGLQKEVERLEKEGRPGAMKMSSLKVLSPVRRPGKMFYAAQNFQEHVDEMLRAGMTPKEGPKFTGEKSTSKPYLFLKAPSTLCGAYDDIAIPTGLKKIDWEAEIACVIGKPGKHIKAEHALDHIAGWMTTNDVSARDLQIRADRPGLRSDWLNGKSHDNFAPTGPFLVPRAFVKDHMKLFIKLSVNGEIKQNGNTSQFIFTPEEQIEYASGILSLQSGDFFSCGTCGGVGQGTNTFLNVGDVMETEVEGLGKMRNKMVAEA
jgi:2,4-didehydro-3-deoxy-L-rhamnonate hydrolase